MLDQFTISSKNADIAFLEAENMIDLAISSSDIYAFTEAVDESGKEGIGSKIVKKIKDLADKIIKFFQDFYNSAKAKILGNKIKEDPKALENKKAEILDTKKLLAFRKKYKARIEKAKSVEEVDAIVAEYDKKNKQIIAGSVAGFVAAVPLAVLGKQIASGKLKEAGDKMINDLRGEADKARHEWLNEYNSVGSTSDGSGSGSPKETELWDNVKNTYKEFKKKSTDNKNGDITAKKIYALQKLISDDMKSVKDYFTSAVSAVSNGFKGAVQNAKKGIDQVMPERIKKGLFKENDVVESADEILGDDFSSFEEAFDDLTFFGDDLFEESGLSDVGKKVSNAIKVLIEKIKKLYEEIKSKMEVAKIRAILGTKTAKSTIKIKFAINDKNITKTVGLYMKAYNNSIVEVKKIEKKFTSGKITVDEMNAELDREEAKFYTEVSRISSTNVASKVNPDEHEARAISEYLGNLTKYQDKVVYELNKSIQDELTRLQKEAEAAERAKLQKEAEEKKKVANAVAKRNKKILAVVISAIGLTGAVALFATQIKKKSSTESTFNESVEEIEGMFAESAEIGSEDAFFGEEIFGNLDTSGDTEF